MNLMCDMTLQHIHYFILQHGHYSVLYLNELTSLDCLTITLSS